MSRPQLGGYEFNYELNRLQIAANEINASIGALLKNNMGPQSVLAHVANMAHQIGIILDAIAKIKTIGEQAKTDRTTR